MDAGLSLRQIERRLSAVGGSMERVRAVLVSHEHGDHVKGLPTLMKRYPVSVHMTEGTARALARQAAAPPRRSRVRTLPARGPLRLGPWTVRAFRTPHDAEEPVGFVLEADGLRVGIATDMGEVTTEAVSALSGLNALVLEFNHDPGMLASGPYPAYVKARIASAGGHLANGDAGRLLREVAHEGLRSLVLAHLSEINNEPELARSAAEQSLNSLSVRTDVARREAPSAVLDLDPGDDAGGQLGLTL